MEAQPYDEKDRRGDDHASALIFHQGIKRSRDGEVRLTHLGGFTGLEIDRAIFSLDAVLRASYKFADRCHVFLRAGERENTVVAMFRSKGAVRLESAIADFGNELIDQMVREGLERQFGDIRTLLVAQAFSEGNLLDAQRQDGDVEADPKQIATSR